PVDAAMLRARAHKERKDFAAARWLLEGALARAPSALGPWVVLSHVLIAEGRDWAGAERALRQVLTLEPRHAEAKHNLNVLVRQRGRPQEACARTRPFARDLWDVTALPVRPDLAGVPPPPRRRAPLWALPDVRLRG